MGSSDRQFPGSMLDRFRTWARTLRGTTLSRPSLVRWGLPCLALVAALLLVHQGTAWLSRSESAYLNSGRRYSADDLIKVCKALDRQRIEYHIDDRRVAVATDQHESASTAIAKLEIGPRSLGEIRDAWSTPSIWESEQDRKLREQQGHDKTLESMISELPGVVGAFVSINRPRVRVGLRPEARPSAFVRLETDQDRQLPFRTVQAVTTILHGFDPALTAETVTVMDRRGHKYLDAGNPALSALSHNRAREEELSQEILEKLDWITGVRVSVQLTDQAASIPMAVARSGSARSGTAITQDNPEADTARATPREEVDTPEARPAKPPASGPVIAVNRPLDLDLEPELPPGHGTSAAPAPAPAALADATKAASPASTSESDLTAHVLRGRIWVRVPRSYFYHVGIIPGRREPTYEELQLLVARTEGQVRKAIKLVLPDSGMERWEEPTIDVIPDEVPLGHTGTITAAPDSRRMVLDWGIAGAAGALAATLVVVGGWLLSSRRPAARSEASPAGLRFHRGTASTPGPTERAREFVRRNPEVAASVLERWTSQGGETS